MRNSRSFPGRLERRNAQLGIAGNTFRAAF